MSELHQFSEFPRFLECLDNKKRDTQVPGISRHCWLSTGAVTPSVCVYLPVINSCLPTNVSMNVSTRSRLDLHIHKAPGLLFEMRISLSASSKSSSHICFHIL